MCLKETKKDSWLSYNFKLLKPAKRRTSILLPPSKKDSELVPTRTQGIGVLGAPPIQTSLCSSARTHERLAHTQLKPLLSLHSQGPHSIMLLLLCGQPPARLYKSVSPPFSSSSIPSLSPQFNHA